MSAGTEEPEERSYLTDYAGLPKVEWTAMSLVAAILVVALTAIVGLSIVQGFDPGLDTQAGMALAQLVVGISLGGTAIGFAIHSSKGDVAGALRSLGLRRVALGMLGLAALAWLVYSFASLTVGSLLDPEQDPVTDELGTDEGSVLSILVTGFLVIPVAAISEELFFRGFMFAGLRSIGAGLWVAAAISSGIWASLHLGAGNLGVVAILAAFGLVLSWLYERSGSLWVPIAAHALNNTVAFTLLLVA